MNRRRFIWQKAQEQSGLPEGYTAVDYIQNTVTAFKQYYFDTEIIATQNTVVEVKYAAKLLHEYGYFLFGSRVSVDTSRFFCYLDSNSGGRNIFACGHGSAESDVGVLNDQIIICKYSSDRVVKMDENGNVLKTANVAPSNDFTTSHSLLLCQCWSGNDVSMNRDFMGNIYYTKIYDGDNLVRDFVPCLDAEGVPCLYDFVSQKPFYNKGSGSFTWG